MLAFSVLSFTQVLQLQHLQLTHMGIHLDKELSTEKLVMCRQTKPSGDKIKAVIQCLVIMLMVRFVLLYGLGNKVV